MDIATSFLAGAAYGSTSVVVGQPLDTVKTSLQARGGGFTHMSTAQAFSKIYRAEGVRGLYRGGTPIFVGGALMRSAQFGVYETALEGLRGSTRPIGGDSRRHVLLAGLCGGIGRGVVEAPFEFVKVRRQVDVSWALKEVYKGSGVTVLRNAGLFSSFAFYMDSCKRAFGDDVNPFLLGACAANGAWLTIWPLDVVKSKMQSGRYPGSFVKLLREVASEGTLFRGVFSGLARSTLANGASMTVFVEVKRRLAAD